jgi:plastocyanin
MFSNRHSKNNDRHHNDLDKQKYNKFTLYIFVIVVTTISSFLLVLVSTHDAYDMHSIFGKSLNQTKPSQTNTTISQMSTTEANETTNANAASPFPPKMANQTGSFPPNNKAEIVKGAALLRDKAYQPNPVRVKAGGSVTWTNLDTVVHTITYGKGITDPEMGTVFDSGMLGGSFSHRFFKPGTFSYFCQIHPTMVGEVIVK